MSLHDGLHRRNRPGPDGWQYASQVSSVDDAPIQQVTLDFAFPWYSNMNKLIFLGPNGALHFDGVPPCCDKTCTFSTTTCTFNTSYMDLIGMGVTDLNPSDQGEIWYKSTKDQFSVMYRNVSLFFFPPRISVPLQLTYFDFQVDLDTRGRITITYYNMFDPTFVPGAMQAVALCRYQSDCPGQDFCYERDCHLARSYFVGLRPPVTQKSNDQSMAAWNLHKSGSSPPPDWVRGGVALHFWPFSSQICMSPTEGSSSGGQVVRFAITLYNLDIMKNYNIFCMFGVSDAADQRKATWDSDMSSLSCLTPPLHASWQATLVRDGRVTVPVFLVEHGVLLGNVNDTDIITYFSDEKVQAAVGEIMPFPPMNFTYTWNTDWTPGQLAQLSSTVHFCESCHNYTSASLCRADCNGKMLGTALYDTCSGCTGGETGRTFNQDMDCIGECFGIFERSAQGHCECKAENNHTVDDCLKVVAGLPRPTASEAEAAIRFIYTVKKSIPANVTSLLSDMGGWQDVFHRGWITSKDQPPLLFRNLFKTDNGLVSIGTHGQIFERSMPRICSTNADRFDFSDETCHWRVLCASMANYTDDINVKVRVYNNNLYLWYHNATVAGSDPPQKHEFVISSTNGGAEVYYMNLSKPQVGPWMVGIFDASAGGWLGQHFRTNWTDVFQHGSGAVPPSSVVQSGVTISYCGISQHVCLSPSTGSVAGGDTVYIVSRSLQCLAHLQVKCRFEGLGDVSANFLFDDVTQGNVLSCVSPKGPANTTIIVSLLYVPLLGNGVPLFLAIPFATPLLFTFLTNPPTSTAGWEAISCNKCANMVPEFCTFDCMNVRQGLARIDDCGVCSSGTSGREPNADKDCTGTCNGNYSVVSVLVLGTVSGTLSSQCVCDNTKECQVNRPGTNDAAQKSKYLYTIRTVPYDDVQATATTATPYPKRQCLEVKMDTSVGGDLLYTAYRPFFGFPFAGDQVSIIGVNTGLGLVMLGDVNTQAHKCRQPKLGGGYASNLIDMPMQCINVPFIAANLIDYNSTSSNAYVCMGSDQLLIRFRNMTPAEAPSVRDSFDIEVNSAGMVTMRYHAMASARINAVLQHNFINSDKDDISAGLMTKALQLGNENLLISEKETASLWVPTSHILTSPTQSVLFSSCDIGRSVCVGPWEGPIQGGNKVLLAVENAACLSALYDLDVDSNLQLFCDFGGVRAPAVYNTTEQYLTCVAPPGQPNTIVVFSLLQVVGGNERGLVTMPVEYYHYKTAAMIDPVKGFCDRCDQLIADHVCTYDCKNQLFGSAVFDECLVCRDGPHDPAFNSDMDCEGYCHGKHQMNTEKTQCYCPTSYNNSMCNGNTRRSHFIQEPTLTKYLLSMEESDSVFPPANAPRRLIDVHEVENQLANGGHWVKSKVSTDSQAEVIYEEIELPFTVYVFGLPFRKLNILRHGALLFGVRSPQDCIPEGYEKLLMLLDNAMQNNPVPGSSLQTTVHAVDECWSSAGIAAPGFKIYDVFVVAVEVRYSLHQDSVSVMYIVDPDKQPPGATFGVTVSSSGNMRFVSDGQQTGSPSFTGVGTLLASSLVTVSTKLVRDGPIRVTLCTIGTLIRAWPLTGSEQGGGLVFVSSNSWGKCNFPVAFECVFGGKRVDATLNETVGLLQCLAPPGQGIVRLWVVAGNDVVVGSDSDVHYTYQKGVLPHGHGLKSLCNNFAPDLSVREEWNRYGAQPSPSPSYIRRAPDADLMERRSFLDSLTAVLCVADCHGEIGGTAQLDMCGLCAGGNTGQVFGSTRDCNGFCADISFQWGAPYVPDLFMHNRRTIGGLQPFGDPVAKNQQVEPPQTDYMKYQAGPGECACEPATKAECRFLAGQSGPKPTSYAVFPVNTYLIVLAVLLFSTLVVYGVWMFPRARIRGAVRVAGRGEAAARGVYGRVGASEQHPSPPSLANPLPGVIS